MTTVLKTIATHKRLLFSIQFFLSLILFTSANASDQATIQITRGQDFQRLFLRDAVYHTEYRQEVYLSTCYREVLVGYDQICDHDDRDHHRGDDGTRGPGTDHGRGEERGPGPGNGRDEERGPGRQQVATAEIKNEFQTLGCHTVPRYVTQAYTCEQVRTVSYQVKDYDVESEVEVRVGAIPAQINQINEVLKINLNGESLSASAVQTSKQVIIRASSTTYAQDMRRGLKLIRQVVDIDLEDLAQAVAPLSTHLVGDYINGQVLVNLGNVDSHSISASLTLIKKRKLWFDKTFFDRTLSANEFTIVPTSRGQSQLRIDLRQLGQLKELDGKIKFRVGVKLNLPRKEFIVNTKDLPDLNPFAAFERKF